MTDWKQARDHAVSSAGEAISVTLPRLQPSNQQPHNNSFFPTVTTSDTSSIDVIHLPTSLLVVFTSLHDQKRSQNGVVPCQPCCPSAVRTRQLVLAHACSCIPRGLSPRSHCLPGSLVGSSPHHPWVRRLLKVVAVRGSCRRGHLHHGKDQPGQIVLLVSLLHMPRFLWK